MFYVTGQTFISSFADYKKYITRAPSSLSSANLCSNESNSSNRRRRNIEMDLIDEQQKLEKSLNWLPAILIVACLLPLLCYLYILLVLPEIMKSTNLVYNNNINSPNGNASSNNNSSLPLILSCSSLSPRQTAKTVNDLRADDIKVVIGIGDR